MKRASQILLIVTAVLSFVGIVGLLIGAIVLFVFGSPAMHDMIVKGIQEGTINTSFDGDPETVANAVQAMFITAGVIVMIAILPTILCAIFSLVANKKSTDGWYIVVIVFSALTGSLFGIVGGILGVVANSGQPKQVQ